MVEVGRGRRQIPPGADLEGSVPNMRHLVLELRNDRRVTTGTLPGNNSSSSQFSVMFPKEQRHHEYEIHSVKFERQHQRGSFLTVHALLRKRRGLCGVESGCPW